MTSRRKRVLAYGHTKGGVTTLLEPITRPLEEVQLLEELSDAYPRMTIRCPTCEKLIEAQIIGTLPLIERGVLSSGGLHSECNLAQILRSLRDGAELLSTLI